MKVLRTRRWMNNRRQERPSGSDTTWYPVPWWAPWIRRPDGLQTRPIFDSQYPGVCSISAHSSTGGLPSNDPAPPVLVSQRERRHVEPVEQFLPGHGGHVGVSMECEHDQLG